MPGVPVFTPTEAKTRGVFLTLMNSLSYPGRIQSLTVAAEEAFVAVGETLLDLETSYFTVDAELSHMLSRTTARTEPIDRAEYIFYPSVTENDLELLATANLGSMLYPDQAATLILGGTLGNGTTLQLSGPGIQGSNTVQVGNIPAEFWTLRQRVQRYPLGWDIFVLDGDRVIGLPRSTQIDSER